AGRELQFKKCAIGRIKVPEPNDESAHAARRKIARPKNCARENRPVRALPIAQRLEPHTLRTLRRALAVAAAICGSSAFISAGFICENLAVSFERIAKVAARAFESGGFSRHAILPRCG